jgi:indolepyruvate decarboxylase
VAAAQELTIARHLVDRLRSQGVTEAFGIVGDYVLKLVSELTDEGLPVLVTADEQGAGFAADAYSRVRGLGAVVCTYGVGGLKLANAVAGAWAEQVPLLVVSGAPGVAERSSDALLHHRVKDFDSQLQVFRDLTCAQAVLTSTHSAAEEIDRVISTVLSDLRPGYIEVPRDMVSRIIEAPDGGLDIRLPAVDPDALRHAVDDVAAHLRAARTAVIHAGSTVQRRRVGDDLFRLATQAGIPVATSSLARGVFPERHRLGMGVYLGALSPASVVERMENAEVFLSLGVLQTDLTLGAFTAHIDHERLILATDDDVTVGYVTYRKVPLWAFLPALADALAGESMAIDHSPLAPHGEFVPDDRPLTVADVVHAIEAHTDDRHCLLLDPGEALFSAVDMRIPTYAHASAYYATMGYAVPAALGVGRADPQRRPVVVVGDGAFAMTGLESGSCAYHGIPAVVVVLDNAGYGTQRPIVDGAFNDIPSIAAERLVDVFGTGRGFLAVTSRELDDALAFAVESDELCIIRVRLPKDGRSAALERLGEALRARA